MPEIISIGRRNEGDRARFPFADRATLTTRTGLGLDPDAIVDAILYPPGAGAGVRIASVTRTASLATIAIGDRLSASLATVSFDPAAPPSHLRPDADGRPAGLLVVDPDRLAALQAWPLGVHAFAVGAAEFVATCCVPAPASLGVTAIRAAGRAFAGDVWLLGRDGVVLTHVPEGNKIRIDAVGDPLWARRSCQDAGMFAPPSILKELHVQGPDGAQYALRPDENGRIWILVSDVYGDDSAVRVDADGPDGIEIGVAGKKLAR